MSRHSYKSLYQNQPVLVVMGWDRPLQGFFCTVERLNFPDPDSMIEDGDDENDGMVFSNLGINYAGTPHPPTPEIFVDALRDLAIHVPVKMVLDVLRDADYNVGNKFVEHIDSRAYDFEPLDLPPKDLMRALETDLHEAGIADQVESCSSMLDVTTPVSGLCTENDKPRWLSAMPVRGSSEGHYVHITLLSSEGRYTTIGLIKTFGGFDVAMKICAVCAASLGHQ